MMNPRAICVKCKHVTAGPTDDRLKIECRANRTTEEGLDPITGRALPAVCSPCYLLNHRGDCHQFEALAGVGGRGVLATFLRKRGGHFVANRLLAANGLEHGPRNSAEVV